MKRLMFLLFILSLFGPSVFAQSKDIRLEEQRLEESISQVLRPYDPHVLTRVKLTPKGSQSKLPGTPFLFQNVLLDDSESTLFEKADIQIFTSKNKEDILSRYQESIRSIASVVVKGKINVQATEVASAGILGMLSNPLFLGISILSLVILMSVFLRKRESTLMSQIIDQNFKSLGSSLENLQMSGLGGASGGDASSRGDKTNLQISTSLTDEWEKVNIKVAQALIMDCYWCQKDEYAAFIWNKLSIDKKIQLLENEKELDTYSKYIASLDEIDESYIKDSYYLHPLPIDHIDNETLAEIIREYPALFHHLPQMRLEKISLSAKERLSLSQLKEKELTVLPNWDKYQAKSYRELKSHLKFFFSSIEEEEDFFNNDQLDLSIADSFPSLVWLEYLAEDDVRSIFNSFSAKELAQAWLGPEKTLIHLEKLLSDKKAELLNSYLLNTTPSRRSLVFEKIQQQALNFLKQKIEASTSQQKAA